jgi:hypothetical protein
MPNLQEFKHLAFSVAPKLNGSRKLPGTLLYKNHLYNASLKIPRRNHAPDHFGKVFNLPGLSNGGRRCSLHTTLKKTAVFASQETWACNTQQLATTCTGKRSSSHSKHLSGAFFARVMLVSS